MSKDTLAFYHSVIYAKDNLNVFAGLILVKADTDVEINYYINDLLNQNFVLRLLLLHAFLVNFSRSSNSRHKLFLSFIVCNQFRLAYIS